MVIIKRWYVERVPPDVKKNEMVDFADAVTSMLMSGRGYAVLPIA